jgi:hypothetical protein
MTKNAGNEGTNNDGLQPLYPSSANKKRARTKSTTTNNGGVMKMRKRGGEIMHNTT